MDQTVRAAATDSDIPVWAMVHLTHAALQYVADESGVDLLHIKGPATSTMLRSGPHDSTDADVLVRPAHRETFERALVAHGWTLHTDFEDGSPFAHAANYVHPAWTYADVHREIPGARESAATVFERFWRSRDHRDIGSRRCAVLSLPGQVLVQVLHAARSHGAETPDPWRLCPDAQRPLVRELARTLDAETAFAAGIGELDRHRGSADYALWAYWSQSRSDRLGEWSARWRSTRGILPRLHLAASAVRVNRTHLRLRLGREPRYGEIVTEQFHRIGLLTRESCALLRARSRR